MPNSSTETNRNATKAWVVTVEMGLGHLRAAYALRDLAVDGHPLVYGDTGTITDPREAGIVRRTRRIYYLFSRMLEWPLIGRLVSALLDALFKIPDPYPERDLSKPTFGLRYLNALIRFRGFGASLARRLAERPRPTIHTFFATAIAQEAFGNFEQPIFVLATDSDINRVWVPNDPKRSTLRYLAPCANVVKRLRSYGVPDERIILTGFPLPQSCIGSRERLEVLKDDLFNRLLRLDPHDRFFSLHGREVCHFLGDREIPKQRRDHLTVLFAVGGSGVQAAMARDIIAALAAHLDSGKVRLFLSAGVNGDVKRQFEHYLDECGVYRLDGAVRIIHADGYGEYFSLFNAALRECDVLWTKPSELSFYCALGIPIIFSAAVGYHEKINRRWVREMGAGFKMPGPARCCDEWLFEMRRKGRLAEAAWNGFLKGRKLGTYAIEEVVATGSFTPGEPPLGA